jgi:hypothetical protein
MNTIENNKLIAVFMGYRFYKHLPFKRNGWQLESNKDTALYLAYSDSDLKYHSSWEWLMTVVEKIDKIGYTVDFQFSKQNSRCGISGYGYANVEKGSPKESAYKAVVEFIKWYNKNL